MLAIGPFRPIVLFRTCGVTLVERNLLSMDVSFISRLAMLETNVRQMSDITVHVDGKTVAEP